MTTAWTKRVVWLSAIGVAGLALIWHPATTHATVRTTSSSRARLVTFAGAWGGHTRGMTITRSGHAKESIGSGCCDPIVDLRLRLSHPRGTSTNASVTVRVVAVTVQDSSAFTKAHPAPQVGQTGRMKLKNGVITEPLTDTTYCDKAAGLKGVCGA